MKIEYLKKLIEFASQNPFEFCLLTVLIFLISFFIFKFFYKQQLKNKQSEIDLLKQQIDLLEKEREVHEKIDKTYSNPVWEKERKLIGLINEAIQSYLTGK